MKADALSCLPKQANIVIISIALCGNFKEIRRQLIDVPTAQSIIQMLQEDPNSVSHYAWDNKDFRL